MKKQVLKTFAITASTSLLSLNIISPFASIWAASSDEMDAAEAYIADKIKKHQYSINLNQFNLSTSEFTTVFNRIRTEHPDLFFINSAYTTTIDGSTFSNVTFYSPYSADEISKMSKEYYSALANAMSCIDNSMSDIEKVIAINQHLSTTVKYADSAENCQNNAYGALVAGETMCHGYTLAAKAMLDSCGIENNLQPNDIGNHIWNVVKINGAWYNLDITSNDTSTPRNGSIMGCFVYTYLLGSDNKFKENDQIPLSSTEVKCQSTIYDNAFWNNTNSNICYSSVTKQWYFVQQDSDGYSICSLKFKNGIPETAAVIKKVSGNYRPALASFNGEIYLSLNGTSVAKLDEKTGMLTTVWKASSDQLKNGKIYALASFDGQLHYSIKNSFVSSDSNIGIISEFLTDDENNIAFPGDGTAQNPYLISTEEHLIKLSTLVNNGNDFKNTYFKLNSNISLSNNFIPIGNRVTSSGSTVSFPFSGNFDGNGYSISGLNITSIPTGSEFSGLFGCVSSATIKNLTLVSPRCSAGKTNGALAGLIDSSSIKNILITANENNDTASIAGQTSNSTYNNICIIGETNQKIVSGTSTFNNCYFAYETYDESINTTSNVSYLPQSEMLSSGLIWTMQHNNEEDAVEWTYNDLSRQPILNWGKSVCKVDFVDDSGKTLCNSQFYCKGAMFSSPLVSYDKIYTWSKDGIEYTNEMAINEDTVLNGTTTNILKGSGTMNDPYIISDTSTLNLIANKINNGEFSSLIHVDLLCDLDISGYNISIGTKEHPFLGQFNGNGKTIINDNATNPLFGYVDSSSVLFDFFIQSKNCKAPSFFCLNNKGWIDFVSILPTSYFNDEFVKKYDDNTFFAGAVASKNTGKLTQCSNYAGMNWSGNDGVYVGGLVGNNAGYVLTSLSEGKVSGGNVGGLIGYDSAGEYANTSNRVAYNIFAGSLSCSSLGGTIIASTSCTSSDFLSTCSYVDCNLPPIGESYFEIPSTIRKYSQEDLYNGKCLYEINKASPDDSKCWSLISNQISNHNQSLKTTINNTIINSHATFIVKDASYDIYSNNANFTIINTELMGSLNNCKILAWTRKKDNSSIPSFKTQIDNVKDGEVFEAVTQDLPATISIADCDIDTIDPQTYSGSSLTPDVKITYKGALLEKGVDYEISYSNNIAVSSGKALATITGKGKYESTVNIYFDIVPKPIFEMSFPTATAGIEYGDNLTQIPISFSKNDYGTFVWDSSSSVPAVGTQSAQLTFIPSENTIRNYDISCIEGYDEDTLTIKRKVPITVSKRNVTININVKGYSLDHANDKIVFNYSAESSPIYSEDSISLKNLTLSVDASPSRKNYGIKNIVATGVDISNPESYNIQYVINPSSIDFQPIDRIKSVSIASLPTKTNYSIGEDFDPTGLEITIEYEDGQKKNYSEFTSAYNALISQLKTIKISSGLSSVDFAITDSVYNQQHSVSIPITMKTYPVELILSSAPQTTTYYEGDIFDPTGLVISQKMSDGTLINITDQLSFNTNPLSISDDKISINYNGLKLSIPITVKKDTISRLAITSPPAKTSYLVGESFDSAGLGVCAIWDSGKTTDVTSDVEIIAPTSLSASDQSIIIKYSDMQIPIAIVVSKPEAPVTLDYIQVTTMPTKTVYFNGDLFDPSGTVISAVYSNGDIKDVTESCVFSPQKLSNSTQEITVSYENKTATIPISVKAIEPIQIRLITSPTKTEYVAGQFFDPTGMSIEVVYNNNTTKTITDWSDLTFDQSPLEENTFFKKVFYKDLSINIPILVEAPKVESINIISAPKLTYAVNDEIDLSGLVINAVYNNGVQEKIYAGDFESRGISLSLEDGSNLPLVASKDLSAHKLKITFGSCSVSTENFVINKMPSRISVICGDTIFGNDPIPIVSGDNIDNVSYSYFSDEQLSIPVSPSSLSVGTYYVVATTPETELYESSSSSASFRVTPHPSTATISCGMEALAGQDFTVSVLNLQADSDLRVTISSDSVDFIQDGNKFIATNIPDDIKNIAFTVSVESKNYAPFSTTKTVPVRVAKEDLSPTNVVLINSQTPYYGDKYAIQAVETHNIPGIFTLVVDDKEVATSGSGLFNYNISDISSHIIDIIFTPNSQEYLSSSTSQTLTGLKRHLIVSADDINVTLGDDIGSIPIKISGQVESDDIIQLPTIPFVDTSSLGTVTVQFNNDLVISNQDFYDISYVPFKISVKSSVQENPSKPDNHPEDVPYSINIIVEGLLYDTLTVKKGMSFELPDLVSSYGDRFEGWFVDSDYATPFVFSNNIASDLTLFAKIRPDTTPITPPSPTPTPDINNPSTPRETLIGKWTSFLTDPNVYKNGIKDSSIILPYIPQEVIKALKDTDIPITIQSGLSSVSFNSQNLPEVPSDIYFNIKKSNIVPSKTIKEMVGRNKETKEYSSINSFSSIKANINFDLGRKYAGEVIDLYCYDKDTNLLSFYASSKVSSGGVVSFSTETMPDNLNTFILVADKIDSDDLTYSDQNEPDDPTPSENSKLKFFDLSVGAGQEEENEIIHRIAHRNKFIIPFSLLLGLIASLMQIKAASQKEKKS